MAKKLIPEDHALLLAKFGEYKWIKKLRDGEVSFSCPGKYIYLAQRYHNDEQGDENEAIFARLRKGDIRINHAANKLNNDLEIIDDGKYVKLRRKSSCRVPVFCFYSIIGSDLLRNVTHTGLQDLPHHFDNKIFTSFAQKQITNVLNNDHIFTSLFIQPRPFIFLLTKALFRKKYGFRMGRINYTEFERDEFYIEPSKDRNELFYKFPRYYYQQEVRICLPAEQLDDIDNRLNIHMQKLADEDMPMIEKTKISLTVKLDIGRKQ